MTSCITLRISGKNRTFLKLASLNGSVGFNYQNSAAGMVYFCQTLFVHFCYSWVCKCSFSLCASLDMWLGYCREECRSLHFHPFSIGSTSPWTATSPAWRTSAKHCGRWCWVTTAPCSGTRSMTTWSPHPVQVNGTRAQGDVNSPGLQSENSPPPWGLFSDPRAAQLQLHHSDCPDWINIRCSYTVTFA